jgi:stearoyl-CoA desaturase (delta-9 desaturase)
MAPFFIALVLFYLYHALGITVGYHRLLSHRSFKVAKLIEYFFVSGAYLALEGAPIFWITTHRLHHKYSDRKGDPHSPLDGFFHSFIKWMWSPTVKMSEAESRQLAPDLYRDPLYRLLHCRHTHLDGVLCLVVFIAFRVLIYNVFGFTILMANLIATFFAFLGPLLVNSFGHIRRFGYETYPCKDNSRNVWFVALFSLGEGWHNNHHAFPFSARHGLRAAEFDPSWLVIRILSTLGLATDVLLVESGAKACDSQVSWTARDGRIETEH